MEELRRNPRVRFLAGILFSVLSGLMLLFAFPPYGVWWLVWFAFVPGIYAQFRLLPVRQSSLAPAIYLLVWLGPYLARLFGTQFGPFFTYLGVLVAVLGYFTYRERRFIERTGYRFLILLGVVNWVGFEMVRATFIPVIATSAFIGYSQASQAWLIQPVSILSVYGLNLLIMLVNYALAQALISLSDQQGFLPADTPIDARLSRKWLMLSGLLLLIWIAGSLFILNAAPDASETVRVAALRANYPLPAHRDEMNTAEFRLRTFEDQAGIASAQGAEVLVTSEMMFNFDPQVDFAEKFRKVARETNTYIFIGYSVLREGEPRRNQAVLLSPDGTFSEIYNKTHIPPGERYDVPGGSFPVFETTFGRMAALICADGNYTDVARKLTLNGAQLIAAPYFEFPGFGEQLWQNVTFRSVENQVATVVAGATSVAAVIDPNGRQIALEVNKDGSQSVLVADVSLGPGGGTIYSQLGDLLGWVSMTGLVVFTLAQIWDGRKNR